MKIVSFAALLLAAAAPSIALAQTAPQDVQQGHYKVESNHTLARFSVNHFGFNNFFGTIPGATGTLALNPANLAATQLDVTLPVAGISTTNATLDGELKSADWFDAARYPTMHFVSQKVEKTGPRSARITGSLTMHGVTRPLVLEATLGGAGVNPLDKAYTVGFAAHGTIKRSEFGVAKYVPMVSDEVAIDLTAAFEKAE